MAENTSENKDSLGQGERNPTVTIRFEHPERPAWCVHLAQKLRPWQPLFYRAVLILGGLWIFGGMFFFFIRFSIRFYIANKGAIQSLVNNLLP